MDIVTPGFAGRPRREGPTLPPGQYLEEGFPVMSAGPTPRVSRETWRLTLTTERGVSTAWSWAEFTGLPSEKITTDLHCVTQWSKLGTTWRGVPVEALLDGVDTAADFAMAGSYGGYTTNVPLADLVDGQAWIAYEFEGEPLRPEHGGPARLLVPHLYLWKSAKWIDSLRLMLTDEPGFWERAGYHEYGDPWREQRYSGD
jgi:DMSO/TMAO reductase YedYZ molybdopterin-dependent catalytic subunit